MGPYHWGGGRGEWWREDLLAMLAKIGLQMLKVPVMIGLAWRKAQTMLFSETDFNLT